jgi:ornithine cyclodeaminase
MPVADASLSTLPIVSEPELRRVMTPARAVAVIRQAFRADGLGQATVPPPINLAIPGSDGEFHVKTAHVEGIPHVAVKIASGFYRNASRGLPTGAGLMALFDASTGMPVALLLDNGYLTDVRTGAAGAVAAEYLAPAAIETVGVIGAGVQARHQLRCLREVRAFERVVAWSIDPDGTRACCEEMREELGVEAVEARSAEEVAGRADLLVTVTPSTRPLVQRAWLRRGMHVTAVGADGPGKQELDPRCLSEADLVVVDRLSQCARLGELQHALAGNMMRAEDVHAELGQVVAGLRPRRTSDELLTVADLTGVGFQDTAIASAAYGLITERG